MAIKQIKVWFRSGVVCVCVCAGYMDGETIHTHTIIFECSGNEKVPLPNSKSIKTL